MVSRSEMRSYLPPLVKKTKIISEYPGYSYQYFQTFCEVNEYFTDLCGPDWLSQDWARVWVGEHSREKMRKKREDSYKSKTASPKKSRRKFNRPIYLVRAIIRTLVDEGLSQNEIEDMLVTRYGIELEKE